MVNRSQRFLELDALRGVAALAVLLLHYTSTVKTILPRFTFAGYEFMWGGLGVQLFFMISGFVILMSARNTKDAKSFGIHRALRLYPTYWVCLGITIVTVFGFGFVRLYRPLWEIVVNFSMLQSFVAVRDFDGVYWSLSREIVFYILIFLVMLVSRGRLSMKLVKKVALWWSILGLLLIGYSLVFPSKIASLIVAASVAQYAPLFTLGMYFYLRRQNNQISRPALFLVALIAVIDETLLVSSSSALILAGIILFFAWMSNRSEVKFLQIPPLVWLGSISYPLYLLHQNIGYVVIGLTANSLGTFWSRILAFLLVVLLAYLVHRFIEIRLTRWIKRRLLRLIHKGYPAAKKINPRTT
ncbi:acyltransferase, partial [uncultured Rothia sp.]|uniref:acyltransferase family protein n=1 Tax=uncultured Rothia sp. TaxID=316088 RepID=UPI003216A202